LKIKTGMPKWYFLMWLFIPFNVVSQNMAEWGNMHEKKVIFQGDDILLDSLPIFSSSVSIFQINPLISVPDSLYFMVSGILKWRNSQLFKKGTPLLIRYRTFPKEWINTKSSDFLLIPDTLETFFLMGKSEFESFSMADEFRRIDYSGGFMRGISIGNRQDLVLNSQLNLQLTGEIAPGFTIRAAITDENLPIQAFGNTLQLQEFDKVFIALEKDQFHFTAGDFEIQRDQSHFNNFYKKVQGLKLHFFDKENKWETTGSASFSRGQFQRITLDVSEGNQGPYRISTPSTGVITVILAGTEKVFINGKKAIRGTSGDYIIDYNRGEIIFTPNQLMLRETRVVVEFEYANTEQNRSILAFNSQYQHKNGTFFINGLTQQDSKTSHRYRDLKEEDVNTLANSTSALEKLYLPGWESSDDTDPTRTYYTRRDTLLPCGKIDTFFIYVNQSLSDKYTVKFGVPSSGKGNYRLSTQLIGNDRIYEYVPPDPITCEPQGQYEPFIPIFFPLANSILTIGQESKIFQKMSWRTEMGLSLQDNNRFSSYKNTMNTGLASWNEWKWQSPLGASENLIDITLSHEFVSKKYSALEPIRQPDFLRDWGLTNQLGKAELPENNENTLRLKINYNSQQGIKLDYQIEHYLRQGLFNGLRQNAAATWANKNSSFTGAFNQVTANYSGENTSFSRPNIQFIHTLPGKNNWQFSGQMEGERKVQQNPVTSLIHSSSFAFHQVQFSVKSPEKKANTFALRLQDRTDFLPVKENLQMSYKARFIKLEGTHTFSNHFKMKQIWQYRHLSFMDRLTNDISSKGVLLGQVQGDGSFLKGLIRGNTVYERGSGQEPRLEYTYIKVAPGEGTHIWLDSLFNQDGILQQQEMMIAPFQDQADFIRVNTLSNQYLPTRFLHFTQSVTIDPGRYKGKLFKKYARWQWNSTWRMDKKTTADQGLISFNPFSISIDDPNVVSLIYQQRNVLIINKGHKLWDIQIGNNQQLQKWLQTIGSEMRVQQESFLKLRWNMSNKWLIRTELGKGANRQKAERFPEKNFDMNTQKGSLSLQFLPTNSFRSLLTFTNDQSTPREWSENTGTLNKREVSFSTTWNAKAGQSVQGQMSNIFIQYSGMKNSPASFALLQGLQTGNNWQWTLQFEKIIGRNIRLLFKYQGRKSATGPIFHIGNIQLGATF